MELQGTIKAIGQTIQISEKFSKRELVIVTNEQYQQSILIQFTQDKCAILDKYQVGQIVKIGINLQGKEYADKQTGEIKYYNTIQGWNINTL